MAIADDQNHPSIGFSFTVEDGLVSVEQRGERDRLPDGRLGGWNQGPPLVKTRSDVSFDVDTRDDDDENGVSYVEVQLSAYHASTTAEDSQPHYHIRLETYLQWSEVEALHAALGAMIAAHRAGAL